MRDPQYAFFPPASKRVSDGWPSSALLTTTTVASTSPSQLAAVHTLERSPFAQAAGLTFLACALPVQMQDAVRKEVIDLVLATDMKQVSRQTCKTGPTAC